MRNKLLPAVLAALLLLSGCSRGAQPQSAAMEDVPTPTATPAPAPTPAPRPADAAARAYSRVLEQLEAKQDPLSSYLNSYFLYDLNGDAIPEMLLKTGTSEDDSRCHLFTYGENYGAVLVGSFDGRHGMPAPYGQALLIHYVHMGHQSVSRVSFDDFTLREERITREKGILSQAPYYEDNFYAFTYADTYPISDMSGLAWIGDPPIDNEVIPPKDLLETPELLSESALDLRLSAFRKLLLLGDYGAHSRFVLHDFGPEVPMLCCMTLERELLTTEIYAPVDGEALCLFSRQQELSGAARVALLTVELDDFRYPAYCCDGGEADDEASHAWADWEILSPTSFTVWHKLHAELDDSGSLISAQLNGEPLDPDAYRVMRESVDYLLHSDCFRPGQDFDQGQAYSDFLQ